MGESKRGVFLNTKLKLLLLLTSSVLFAVIVWFVYTTFSAERKSRNGQALDDLLRLDASNALAILRVLQGLMTLASASALAHSLELVQWCLCARSHGISYVVFLILSPATGHIATLRLLFSRSIKRMHRMWALTKLILSLSVYLAALLLFVKTSRVTVYDTIFTYNVTAGVGPFNASYVQPFFETLKFFSQGYPYQVLPYTTYAAVYNLVVNPTQVSTSSPVRCSEGRQCDSYLLNGGLVMTTPWVPSSVSTPHPVVRMTRVQAVQLDFEAGYRSFSDADCETYGEAGVLIAIRVCLRSVASQPESLEAGLFLCQRGISKEGTCLTSSPAWTPNMTTLMTVYSRKATVIATTSNYSITETSELTPPLPIYLSPVDLAAHRQVIRWLLNFTATNTPAPSSMAQNFWSSAEQLADPNPVPRVVLTQSFQSILAFPVWMFNGNNYGNPALQASEMISTLPPDFYTSASIVTSYSKLKVDEGMLIGFMALQGTVLVFIWAVLIWSWRTALPLPAISSFVLFDSTVRLKHTIAEAAEGWQTGADVSDKRILELATEARTYARNETVNDDASYIYELDAYRNGQS